MNSEIEQFIFFQDFLCMKIFEDFKIFHINSKSFLHSLSIKTQSTFILTSAHTETLQPHRDHHFSSKFMYNFYSLTNMKRPRTKHGC